MDNLAKAYLNEVFGVTMKTITDRVIQCLRENAEDGYMLDKYILEKLEVN